MTRLTPEQARELLDRPYVACCGDYAPDHRGTHTRVERDVHDLAREVLALTSERDAAQHAADALRTALDGLRAAVATVRDARAVVAATGAASIAAWDAVEALPTASQTEGIAVALRASYEAGDALNAALDALLSASSPPATAYRQAAHDRELRVAAEDALTTAREERDAARSALDELVAAVRVEREAQEAYEAARNGSTFDLRAYVAACDAAKLRHFDATAALDALLSAAPPPATVPAALVRRQIGAVLAANGCDCDCGHSSDEHDDDCDRCLACRVEGALDAALAGCP